MTDFGTIILFAIITVGAYALIPILLCVLVLALGVVGFIVSIFTREKWK